nr:ankyrin repeat domain-containing protein 6b [Pseudochaenichthys georgianus]
MGLQGSQDLTYSLNMASEGVGVAEDVIEVYYHFNPSFIRYCISCDSRRVEIILHEFTEGSNILSRKVCCLHENESGRSEQVCNCEVIKWDPPLTAVSVMSPHTSCRLNCKTPHQGDTCLHVAARYNHVAVTRILLGAFCSVSESNQVRLTPVHVGCCPLNHKKSVRLLLEGGADSHICNNAGHTALEQAREHNNPEVALLLTKAPKVQSFVRGRSVRKRRDKLKEEGRAQSVPRDQMLPCKDSVSPADGSQSSERGAVCKLTESNTRGGKSRKQKDKPSLSEPLRRKETKPGEALTKRKCKQRGAPLHGSVPPHNYKAYQLYTLYRGKDGKIMQAPLNGCRCEPLISKLENQLEATKEEMKTEIHTVQDLMNSKMGQLDRKNKHQLRALDKMTVERVCAERTECVQRLKQRALQERLEAESRQASLVQELKSWGLSEPGSPPLRRCSPVAEGLDQLPSDQGGGPETRELQHSPAPLDSSPGGPSLGEDGSPKQYFVVHVESSPDGGKAHCAESSSPAAAKSPTSSVQVVRPKERHVVCADMQKKTLDLQDVDTLEAGARGGGIDRASSLSPATERRSSSRTESGLKDRERGRDKGKHHRKHSQGRTKSRGEAGVRTLEVFGEKPSEPSFAQEKDAMHAQEVTQYFFEAVSTQMERWYERKVQEARWQAQQRAQSESAALLERIHCLEDELRMLRTHRQDDC